MSIATIPEIMARLKAGRMVILVDERRPQTRATWSSPRASSRPEAINFMARFGRGLICLTLTADRCRQLNLPLMATRNGTKTGTRFTMSIEAAEGVTTGISAGPRTHHPGGRRRERAPR